MRPSARVCVLGLGAVLVAGAAQAEPMFLSRQYARCGTCHYSPTGGGLLTPYGRSLSREELSTWGGGHSAAPGPEGWGALRDLVKPVEVGIDMRPSHLGIDIGGSTISQNLFMTGDVLAAYRARGWTFYGELGREPLPEGAKIGSYEHWVGHDNGRGFGFRVGRFMPAYGVNLADHTNLTRLNLGFDVYDQIYGIELSQSSGHHLLQVALGPGRAASILQGDGRRALTATARLQWDLGTRSALVLSSLYRGASQLSPRNGAGGVAFGFAPASWMCVWTEVDAQLQQGSPGTPAFTFLNETSLEVWRGLWLKFSPQLRTEFGAPSQGIWRLAFEADLLPHAHWNVDVSYYRDRTRTTGFVTKTFLAQLHLYL